MGNGDVLLLLRGKRDIKILFNRSAHSAGPGEGKMETGKGKREQGRANGDEGREN